MKEYIESYHNLSITDKRDVLLKEMSELLITIENLCTKKKLSIDKLKSSYFIKNKEVLFDEDYYELLFIYITYLKEDLALLLN